MHLNKDKSARVHQPSPAAHCSPSLPSISAFRCCVEHPARRPRDRSATPAPFQKSLAKKKKTFLPPS